VHGLARYVFWVRQASLTGESEPIRKSSMDPWCRSGTQVRGPLARHLSKPL